MSNKQQRRRVLMGCKTDFAQRVENLYAQYIQEERQHAPNQKACFEAMIRIMGPVLAPLFWGADVIIDGHDDAPDNPTVMEY